MPLGTEVGLGPCHIVLDGDPARTKEKVTAPPSILGPCLLWPKRSPVSPTAEHLFTCYFSDPDRALRRVYVCVSVCVQTITFKRSYFDLDRRSSKVMVKVRVRVRIRITVSD